MGTQLGGNFDDQISDYKSNDECEIEYLSDSEFEDDLMGGCLNRHELIIPETRDKSDKTRVTVRCGSLDCPSRVHACILQHGVTFKIKKCNPDHNFTMQDKIKASAAWIANIIVDVFRNDQNVKPSVLKQALNKYSSVMPQERQNYVLKKIALEMIDGNHNDSYCMLPAYDEMVKNTNLGSIAMLDYSHPSGSTIASKLNNISESARCCTIQVANTYEFEVKDGNMLYISNLRLKTFRCKAKTRKSSGNGVELVDPLPLTLDETVGEGAVFIKAHWVLEAKSAHLQAPDTPTVDGRYTRPTACGPGDVNINMDQDLELDLSNTIQPQSPSLLILKFIDFKDSHMQNDHLTFSNDPEFFILNLDHALEYESHSMPLSVHCVSNMQERIRVVTRAKAKQLKSHKDQIEQEKFQGLNFDVNFDVQDFMGLTF
ncbi:hypothetical protein M9H77_03159 [Catharanthus roseus]|uniref:Uncharacterized protein n=1 Tax=Catharanthus roseus TaxID=4058 RepID=A0ACC0CAH1_CATRO|nr:hypothetical protein M9H77_03159 [Catharanthus roseus]